MSVTTELQSVCQFADKQSLATWLNNIEKFSEREEQLVDCCYIPRWVKIGYDKYRECLADSKEFLYKISKDGVALC